jgi:hypothetical protein
VKWVIGQQPVTRQIAAVQAKQLSQILQVHVAVKVVLITHIPQAAITVIPVLQPGNAKLKNGCMTHAAVLL